MTNQAAGSIELGDASHVRVAGALPRGFAPDTEELPDSLSNGHSLNALAPHGTLTSPSGYPGVSARIRSVRERIQRELVRIDADRPSRQRWLAEVRSRSASAAVRLSADSILAARDADRR